MRNEVERQEGRKVRLYKRDERNGWCGVERKERPVRECGRRVVLEGQDWTESDE